MRSMFPVVSYRPTPNCGMKRQPSRRWPSASSKRPARRIPPRPRPARFPCAATRDPRRLRRCTASAAPVHVRASCQRRSRNAICARAKRATSEAASKGVRPARRATADPGGAEADTAASEDACHSSRAAGRQFVSSKAWCSQRKASRCPGSRVTACSEVIGGGFPVVRAHIRGIQAGARRTRHIRCRCPSQRRQQGSSVRLIVQVQLGRAQRQVTPFIGGRGLQHSNPGGCRQPSRPSWPAGFHPQSGCPVTAPPCAKARAEGLLRPGLRPG